MRNNKASHFFRLKIPCAFRHQFFVYEHLTVNNRMSIHFVRRFGIKYDIWAGFIKITYLARIKSELQTTIVQLVASEAEYSSIGFINKSKSFVIIQRQRRLHTKFRINAHVSSEKFVICQCSVIGIFR